MPLTPDDVVNKRFSATKFRQGYDEEEVDEFLDEVVGELRRLTAENDELRSKLSACERRVGELSRGGGARPEPVKAPEPTPAPAPAPPPPPPAPAPAPVAAQSPAAAMAAAAGGTGGVAGMLELAQKLHDEHVQAGEAEKRKLIAEAQDHANRLVREAEQTKRETLGTLEQERQMLQAKVDQLKAFEREYRSRLKSYLEGQLRELESTATQSPLGGPGGRSSGSGQASRSGGDAGFGQTAQQPAVRRDEGGSGDQPPRFPFGG